MRCDVALRKVTRKAADRALVVRQLECTDAIFSNQVPARAGTGAAPFVAA
jgi:hypothetical protein